MGWREVPRQRHSDSSWENLLKRCIPMNSNDGRNNYMRTEFFAVCLVSYITVIFASVSLKTYQVTLCKTPILSKLTSFMLALYNASRCSLTRLILLASCVSLNLQVFSSTSVWSIYIAFSLPWINQDNMRLWRGPLAVVNSQANERLNARPMEFHSSLLVERTASTNSLTKSRCASVSGLLFNHHAWFALPAVPIVVY